MKIRAGIAVRIWGTALMGLKFSFKTMRGEELHSTITGVLSEETGHSIQYRLLDRLGKPIGFGYLKPLAVIDLRGHPWLEPRQLNSLIIRTGWVRMGSHARR